MVMAKQKSGFPVWTILGILIFLAAWYFGLRYSNWYFYTGFYQPNEIMKYCSQFNDTSLGWFEYVCKHGVLNFVAGYGAVFALLVPVILLIQLFCKKSFGKMMLVLVKFFFTALLYLVLIVGILYSALFLMEQLPIVAGLLLIIGVAMILPAGQTLLVIVVVD